jgi:hypothetical protein
MAKGDNKIDARQSFRDFATELHGCAFERIGSPKDYTRALAKFYISKLHNVLKTEIDDDEFDDGYVDNAGDLDIDLIHRDDHRVLILQSRYHGTQHAGEKAADIARFQGVLSRMRSDKFKANAKLQDILSTIDWERDSFEMVYLSFSKIAGQALDQTTEKPAYPSDVPQLEERCTWEFLGEQEFSVELRRAATLVTSTPDVTTTLFSAGPKSKRSEVIEVQSGTYRSCVMAVEASHLVAAYHSIGDALFSLNIRNFLGNTKNNQKIVETAKDRPENFFYFNNGIGCLAESVDVRAGSVVAKKLQVINGAQTVKALVRAAGKLGKAKSWDAHQPIILVRITEVGSYGSSGNFREEITRFNNTQNVIKDADFKSNDAVQKDLAEKFSKIVRPGKRVVYQHKRTDVRPSNAEIIRMEEFAKVIYAFLMDPVSFSGSTSMLFDDDRGYSVVFGDGKSPWTEIPNAEFRMRAGIYWISRDIELLVKADKKATEDPIVKAALERKWFPIFVSRLLLERAFPNGEWRQHVARLYKGDWNLSGDKDGEWIKILYEISKQIVLMVYRMSSKSPKFVHRNWMRSADTVESLKDAVKDFPEFQVKPLLRT